MATSSKIHLDASQQPLYYLPGMTQEAADKASQLLQENHDKHHIFFNKEGFHNHIVHHLLTIYALGATPAELQRGYDINASYQRPAMPLERDVVASMHDPAKFKQRLGDERYYYDYLVFFQEEIDERGCENALNEYVFKGDERADDLLVRLFSGFLHPLIHLGFGLEFRQPAIMAEALAQAACHDNWIGKLLLPAEKAARADPPKEKKTLVELLDAIRGDKALSNAAHWSDGNKIRDGIIARGAEKMLDIAKQYTVDPKDLEWRTAEMINAGIYFTAGAQHPPNLVKFDFYYMHCVNCSIFFPTFAKLASISPQAKARLLEWKGRLDLAMYASRHSPTPLLDEIASYRSKTQGAQNAGDEGSWANVFARARRIEDDGHASKFVRAVANGKRVCLPFEIEGRKEFRVNGETWDRLGQAVMDSVEGPGARWVRSAGFEEAWKEVEERPVALL